MGLMTVSPEEVVEDCVATVTEVDDDEVDDDDDVVVDFEEDELVVVVAFAALLSTVSTEEDEDDDEPEFFEELVVVVDLEDEPLPDLAMFDTLSSLVNEKEPVYPDKVNAAADKRSKPVTIPKPFTQCVTRVEVFFSCTTSPL